MIFLHSALRFELSVKVKLLLAIFLDEEVLALCTVYYDMRQMPEKG